MGEVNAGRGLNIEAFKVRNDGKDFGDEEGALSPMRNNEHFPDTASSPNGKGQGLIFDSELSPAAKGGNINLTISRVEQSTFLENSPYRRND